MVETNALFSLGSPAVAVYAFRLRLWRKDQRWRKDKGTAGKQSTALGVDVANPRQYPALLRCGDCATAAEH